jgi:hypothetical protein
MLTTDQINDWHHLYGVEHWPIRQIEQRLSMSWRTIKKYLEAPAQTPATPNSWRRTLALARP